MTSASRRRGKKKPELMELAISATCRLTFRSKGDVATLCLDPLKTTFKPASLRTRKQPFKDLNQALAQ